MPRRKTRIPHPLPPPSTPPLPGDIDPRRLVGSYDAGEAVTAPPGRAKSRPVVLDVKGKGSATSTTDATRPRGAGRGRP